MKRSRTLLALLLGSALSLATVSVASAQVVITGPPVLLPATAPAIVLPSPYPVVTTYSIPTAAPRVVGYGTYRPPVVSPSVVSPSVVSPSVVAPSVVAPSVVAPSVVAPSVVASPPVYIAPVPTTVARPVTVAAPTVLYRPAVVGSGIGGLPTVYVPGQPVRNALRYVLP